MLRALVTLLLATPALGYTLPQAQSFASFQETTRDVLSIIAPTIDPQLKLAAKTTVTLPGFQNASKVLINTIFKGTANPKVVEAQPVVAFQIELRVTASDDIEAVKSFISGWAGNAYGSSSSDVVVTRASKETLSNQGVYVVTISPARGTIWENGFNDPLLSEKALALVGSAPPECDGTLNSRDSISGCTALCTAFTAAKERVVSGSSKGCPGIVLFKTIGYRYGIDFFSSFSVPSSTTVTRLSATKDNVPDYVIQYQLPSVIPEVGGFNEIALIAAAAATSVALLLGMGWCTYKL